MTTHSASEIANNQSIYTTRKISHDEARQIAQRLINSHFEKEPHARVSIPARPDYDDDLLICAYIEQQADSGALVEREQSSHSEYTPITVRAGTAVVKGNATQSINEQMLDALKGLLEMPSACIQDDEVVENNKRRKRAREIVASAEAGRR